MDKRLIKAKPISDTAALFILVFPLIRWLASDVPPRVANTVQLALMIPTLLVSFKVATQPHSPHTESKPTKRSSRQRIPHLWALLVRAYLYTTGHTTLPMSSSSALNSRSFSPQFIPQIRYVGPTIAGVLLPDPSILKFFVNNLPWTQVYVDDEKKVAIFYGLQPNTIYEVRAVVNDDDGDDDEYQNNASLETIEFFICTSLGDAHANVDDSRPRRGRVDVYAETLQSMKTTLADEKLRARKVRKDFLKKLSSLRHEIDTLSTKLATKRKADERARKRIQALRERVAQQKLELSDLETKEPATSNSPDEVARLASEVEDMQREQQSKQQGLEVSVRVWEELQRTKQNEIEKLRQRCAKLSDRLEKARSDASPHKDVKSHVVMEFIHQLREERSARNQRRGRLEADFRSAITRLGT